MKLNPRILKRLVEIKLRLDRGVTLLNWAKNILIIVAGLKFLIDLNIINTILVGILVTIGVYFLGWLDFNRVRLFQTESQLLTEKYNPYFKRLKKRFK